MPLTNAETKKVMKEFAKNEKDTGSSEVQIALMTKKIAHLTEHFKQFKKDNNSKRGLMRLIGRRRRLMRYLQRVNPDRYHAMTSKLGIK